MESTTPAALEAAQGGGTPASAASPAPEASAAQEGTPHDCRSVEAWRDDRGTHSIWFRSAFVRERWCEGLLITAEQYDAAVAGAEGEVCR